ncbi:MAG: hypothetical protein M3345_07185 [Actinomycetota bacterium]|nr:hypothetical protein [Actinomycetota bacterium]
MQLTRAARATAGVIAVTMLTVGSVQAAPTARKRAAVAASYVALKQRDNGSVPGFSKIGSTADAVLSWVAVERGRGAIRKAVRYLELHHFEATSVGLKAKVVLAAVAAGKDPRSFAGHDLVAEIRATQQADGRYGATTPVLEHALAVLALQAAGEPASPEASDWLAAAQCPDGGWSYDEPYSPANDDEHCKDTRPGFEDFYTSDTNTTSYAVQALVVSPGAVAPAGDAFAFFATARDTEFKGGWVYDPLLKCSAATIGGFCYLTDANSTALVLQAHAAAGREIPTGGRRALARLQYPLCGQNAGAFAFTWEPTEAGRLRRTAPDVGATIDAIRGLLLDPLPVAHVAVTRGVPHPPAC